MLLYYTSDLLLLNEKMDVTEVKKISRREQEVWQACDALWQEFQFSRTPISQLTGECIKQKLVALGYKRGNQNQIYQFRNSWKEHHGITDITYSPTPLKHKVLNDKIENAVASVMTLMEQETKDKISHLSLEAEQRIQSNQEQMHSLELQVQDQLTHIQQKDETLVDLEDNLQTLQEKHFELEKDHLLSKERLSHQNEQLESALSESRLICQILTHKVQKMAKELKKLNKQNIIEKSANKTLESQLSKLLDKVFTSKQ